MRFLFAGLMLISAIGLVSTDLDASKFYTWITLMMCVALVEIVGLILGKGTFSALVWTWRDASGGTAGAFGLLAAFIAWLLWHLVKGGKGLRP